MLNKLFTQGNYRLKSQTHPKLSPIAGWNKNKLLDTLGWTLLLCRVCSVWCVSPPPWGSFQRSLGWKHDRIILKSLAVLGNGCDHFTQCKIFTSQNPNRKYYHSLDVGCAMLL